MTTDPIAHHSDTIRPSWWSIASSRPVVKRAFAFLVIVGGILIAINHGDAIVRGDIDSVRLFKMLLTPLVPYMVSTLSSVSAIQNSGSRVPGATDRDGR